jgi:nucleotide-binding universal stress UspA family protein
MIELCRRFLVDVDVRNRPETEITAILRSHSHWTACDLLATIMITVLPMFCEGTNMKIILTTDGSHASENAIRWFCQWPIHDHPSYPVVTVTDQLAFGMVPNEVRDEISRLEQIRCGGDFQRVVKIARGYGLDAFHVPLTGHPADRITRHAQDADAGLVVVSAHGLSQLARALLGSTSETIATHAHCSVLVIRGADQKQFPPMHSIHVTLALDGTENASETLEQLLALGLPSNTKLSLLTVVAHPPLLDQDIQYDPQLSKISQSNLDHMAEQLRTRFPLVETHVVEQVHVGQAIETFLLHSQTDIVVVRDKGRSAISRFFLGSVSRFVLRHAPCSVLVLRATKK